VGIAIGGTLRMRGDRRDIALVRLTARGLGTVTTT
jgi:hypothetical protein